MERAEVNDLDANINNIIFCIYMKYRNVTGRSKQRTDNLKSNKLLKKAQHLLLMAQLRRTLRTPGRLPITPRKRAEAISLLEKLEEERDKVHSLPTSADLNRQVRRLARTMKNPRSGKLNRTKRTL